MSQGKVWGLAVLMFGPLAVSSLRADTSAEIIARARALHSVGRRDEALQAIQAHLQGNRDDTDVRAFYGAMLSWDGRFGDARDQLEQVLAKNAANFDALSALIRVELWSGHPDKAELLAYKALQHHPRNTDLLLMQARALKALRRPSESRQSLDRLLEGDPGNKEAEQLRLSMVEESREWEVSFENSYEKLSDGQDAWRESQLSLKRRTAAGPVIARFSRAERFSLTSNQVEVEFYPRIRRGTWAYLDAGYSNDGTLYPMYRLAGDLNQSLGKGFEGSVGYRRLGFSSAVNIYTPALTKYRGNWLFTGRLFLTPDSVGTSQSFQLLTRRYFGEGTDYVGFRYGRGSSPVEARSISDIQILRASSIYTEIFRSLGPRAGGRWAINVRTGFSREDRLRRTGLNRVLIDAAVYFRF